MAPTEAEERAVLSILDARQTDLNNAIDAEIPLKEPTQLYAASRHLLDAGGKRLRPALLLLVADALADIEPGTVDYRQYPTFDGEYVDMMKAAVSIEVIQSFTLIHDDIMDDDDLRRGVPAVHKEFDLETAILAGDTLYSKAFEIMLQCGARTDRNLRALQTLAETCTQICEGQALDIEFEQRENVTIAEYRRMIALKTAVLFQAASSLPAILLGADEATIDGLATYGRSIGEAFQIHDDVLDLTVPSETLGKQRGSDLIEGKQTLVTIHAAQQGIDLSTLRPDREDENAIESAVDQLEQAGSIAYAEEQASSLVQAGLDGLDTIANNRARSLLDDLAMFLIERGY